MSRFRSRYRRNQKIVSAMKSNTGLVISLITHVDTSYESMIDGTVTKPANKRLTLSESVRPKNQGPSRRARWKFHTLQYTSQDRAEQVIQWTAADSTGGARKWVGSGNLTQHHSVQSGRSMPSWPSLPSGPLEKADLEATSKSLLYLDRPKLSLGEPIAELRTLPRDLSPVLNALERVTRRVKRLASSSRYGRGLRAAKYAASVYAQQAFFYGPLIRTAEDIATEYAQRLDVKDLWQTARGLGHGATPKVFKTTNGSGAGWTFTWEQIRWLEIEVQAGILYSSPDRDISVSGRLGLVKRDWPVTAWELMPLSFLVDRVFNVKRFLKSSAALSSPNVRISRDSFKTIRQKDVRMARIKTIQSPTVPLAFYNPKTSPWYREEDFLFTRTRWWPDIGDIATTSRGSGLFNSLTKLADVTSIVVGHLT